MKDNTEKGHTLGNTQPSQSMNFLFRTQLDPATSMLRLEIGPCWLSSSKQKFTVTQSKPPFLNLSNQLSESTT